MRRARLGALALLMLFACGAPAACSGGVVGGKCRFGYVVCGGSCIDPLTDSDNCGRCGNVCSRGLSCESGVCGGTDASGVAGSSGAGGAPSDGGSGAGGRLDGGRDASLDGGPKDASNGGGASIDSGTGGRAPVDSGRGGTAGNVAAGGTAGSTAAGGTAGAAGTAGTAGEAGAGGTTFDAGQCQPPFNTPDNCGSCGHACPPDAQLCSLGPDGFFCTQTCDPPLVACGRQCVNLDSDENNCGRCGNRCASGICQGGMCVGATAGNEIVFCMDYRVRAASGTPPEQLLENAVFLGSRDTVRILAYSEYSSNPVVAAVNGTLANAAQHRVRSYTVTVAATSLEVANTLNVSSYDVLLVYDQPAAPAGRLAMVGANIADAVDAFVRAGGTAVVLAGSTGVGEMPALVSSAGIVDMTAQQAITGNSVYNRSPADAVGVNVLSPFRAPNTTCRFTTAATPSDTTVFVVTDSPSSSGMLGAPVVVHRVILPP